MNSAGLNTPGYDNALGRLVRLVINAHTGVPNTRALLVGISGIDASGKGFVSAKLAGALRSKFLNVALISADDWLNLPEVCTNPENPAGHFYMHALRLDEMFKRLVVPLRDHRGVDVLTDGDVVAGGDDAGSNCVPAAGVNAPGYRFRKIDVVLLEGIFLFKPDYREYFDLTIWIECSFETALKRAIARRQEGLPPAETQAAFETIYFPAQRIHLDRDDPRGAVDYIFQNDKL